MSRVVHFEIHASNPAQVKAFYETVFGWTITKWDGPMEYWLIDTGKEGIGINGAIVPRRGFIDGQAVIAYVCTIDVSDLDASIKAVLSAGGTIALEKMPVPGIGWLAYAKDVDGNIFGMMQREKAAT